MLSLGTGQHTMGYDAREMAKWGLVDWLSNKGEAPLVDMVFNASADMVDYNLAVMFQSQHCSSNYLRIQVLSPPQAVKHSLIQLLEIHSIDMVCRRTICTGLLPPRTTRRSPTSGSSCPRRSTCSMSRCLSATSKLGSSLPSITMAPTVKLSTGMVCLLYLIVLT